MEITLCIIKPDAVRNKLEGKIIDIILNSGFRIISMKRLQLTKLQAEKFYDVHTGKPFFEPLVEFMTSGPCIPIALEKENAVVDYRKLIGATDPVQAEEGTIRKLYAESKSFNAVHGSDSPENGTREVNFFFPEMDQII